MNPCPCGYYGDSTHECTCSSMIITRYQKRISGPLLDRIDIHVQVPQVDYDKLTDDRLGERSASIRARVEAARQEQRQRFAGTELLCNADMGPAEAGVAPQRTRSAAWMMAGAASYARQCNSCR